MLYNNIYDLKTNHYRLVVEKKTYFEYEYEHNDDDGAY